MKSSHFSKSVSVFLSLLMMLTTLAVGFVPLSALAAVDNSTLIGRYFSTDNVWYDAAKGANGIQWQVGDYPAYNGNLGMTYFNGMYVRIDNNTLFQNVTRDTGVTFAFNYRPNFTGDHRHILSIGQNAYGNGTENQFFISGATSWYSSGHFPVVAWMNGGSETIKAYPEGVTPVLGHDYNIVVVVDKDAGVVFYIDGVKKNTVYVDSDLNGQLGNIRGFLDAVHTYGENYIGCSRWTGDAKIEGYLSDVRIYKAAATETEAYSLVADMAALAFNAGRLDLPSFNAIGYYCKDEATGAYNNLAYASYDDTIFSAEQAVGSQSFKIVTPRNTVMVYDGQHDTYAPIEIEARCNNNTAIWDHYIYYVASNADTLPLKQNWQGFHDGGGDSRWLQWAGYATDKSFAAYVHSDSSNRTDNQNNTGTSRFWWNALKYTGSGNDDSYFDEYHNISFNCWTSYYQLSSFSTHQINGTVNSENNYYVLNYKPVYDVLAAAKTTYNNEMADKAWMYTEESYAKAMLAMRRLALCNPNLYDYNGRGVDAAAKMCAAAIKQAKADYDAINLVKKTATVHINEGVGTAITVTNNGAPVTDGATVEYGDTLTVSAAARDAYDQHTPVVTISDETNAASTLVNRPEITISTAALALNTYTLTFDPNGGTLSGDAAVTATYTQPLPAATPATRIGYTFQSYVYNSGSIDDTYYNENYENIHGNYDVKGDVTVTAQWTPTSYSITFVPNGCTIDASAQANFGSTYTIEDVKTLPTATAPTGYHFDGWTVTASGDHGWGSEKIAANASVEGKWGNVTLTATYSPNTDTAYTVEYYEMGTDGAYPAAATRTETLSGTTGETASADTAAPTGFTYDSVNANNVTYAAIAADGSTVLKVYFSRNQYTVNVTLGEGAALNVANGAKYYYGETVTFNVTAATGYDISTLSMTVDGAPAENGAQVTVTGDITVAVSYLSKLKYTVTVSEGTGSSITGASTGEYEYGTSLTVTASATEGYNDAGLKLMANGAVVSNPYTFTVTGDITISTADLNKLTFTVTKTEGAGTAITGDGSYEWGADVTVSAEALEGYTGALVLRVNGEAVSNPYTFTITGNVAVSTDPRTAITYYTVVFNNYDNTKLYETSVPAGGTAEYQGAEPAKPDEGAHAFTFAGWDKPLENINETTVLTAQFTTVHSYTERDHDDDTHFMKCAECGLIDETTREDHTGGTATCIAKANCSMCGSAYGEVDASNHNNTRNTDAVTANCVAEGFTAGVYCDDCKQYISGHASQGFDYVNGHAYGSFEPNGDGTHSKRCTREGCADTAANHTLTGDCSGGTATCIAKAICSVCGGAYGEVDASNHTNTRNTEAVTANCVTEGFTAGVYCDDCKQYISSHASQGFDYVNGHAYGSFEPNGDGTHSKRCTREGCADTAANHTLTEDCSGGTATCSAKAICSVCGGAYGEEDASNHTNTRDTEAVTANCVTEGFTAGEYCDDCKQYISGHVSQGYDYENGHAYGSFEPNGDGTHTKHCTREGCAATTANHTVTDDCSGGTATCTEQAVCNICGGAFGEALGHDWSVTFTWDDTVTPPTAKAAFVCGRDAEHNVTVDAAVAEIASTAAHCGEEGSVTYRASYTMDGVIYATGEATDKTVTTDSLPHLWSVQSWEWSADYSTVTLNLKCDRDDSHTHQIADIAASEDLVSEATCTAEKKVKYTASAEYEDDTFTTETEEITVADSALGHTYAFAGWTWADDHSSAAAKFVCAVETCGDTVYKSDDEIEENLIAAPDCENDKVVTYTASVEFVLIKGGEAQTFTDTTDEITLENTKTAHAWGEASYTWNGTESVTAKRVCETYASHVEEETATAGYTVTTAPTYTEKGEGTYTAAFTNPAFETKTKTEEIASIKEQIESALVESGSGIDDIDALLEAAEKIVNGEDPYTAPYEESYVDTLSDLLDEFNGSKNDPSKADSLADTLQEIKALVDAHEDHIVYTVTYVLNGGVAENKNSFVRTDAVFTLNNPTRTGCVFAGWTGTGLSEASLTVTVNPADAENKEFTATWTLDNTDAEAAINNAAALIGDADDDYEDAYSEALSDLVSQLEDALAADPQDADAIRGLTDQVNSKIADAANNKHSFTENIGYKEGYAPTCTLSGVTLMKCANCDKTKEVIARALGHDFGEWQVITPAVLGVNGEARRYCSRCDEFESKVLTISAEYDREIKFNGAQKMYFVIEEGDGFNVYNSSTVLWYSAADLHFHVYTYTNSGYTDYTVYINGAAATPDANGTYTVPAGSTRDTVTFAIGSAAPSSDSGACPYCGQTHPNTLWGRLIHLFHVILAFFRDLFKK